MAATPSAGSYLLCGTPRTGSTLLCGLLRDTGVAGVPESYFRELDEQSWAVRWRLARDVANAFDYTDYVRAAIAAGSTANGVFGARVMWGTLDQVVARLGRVNPELAGADLDLLHGVFGPLRFIHLKRADTVAQAVSWVRAEQTQHWQDEDAPAKRLPHFDAAEIRGCIRLINEHNAAWQDWFTTFDIDPYVMRYEDLVADMSRATQGIVESLGLRIPTDRSISAARRRQGDELNEDWIARYRTSRHSD